MRYKLFVTECKPNGTRYIGVYDRSNAIFIEWLDEAIFGGKFERKKGAMAIDNPEYDEYVYPITPIEALSYAAVSPVSDDTELKALIKKYFNF